MLIAYQFYIKHKKTALDVALKRFLFHIVEMRGIEPLSKRISSLTSTIIVILLKFRFDKTPYNRAKLSKLT